ncbi:hypothetical protein [uncultured Erythrobacter sp.]|uniref:hypothetical protein n=1 Tax=uncultured Erythrobacter sp. TaxID=263913 RepID=UPI00262128B5|nr:hypothetical protein [uncultured Erythrobacter sp.]
MKRLIYLSVVYWTIALILLAVYNFQCGFSAGHDPESDALIRACIDDMQAGFPYVFAATIAMYIAVMWFSRKR